MGTWPAIWMLGKNITELGGYWAGTHGTTSWPACGEIDIMEHWGTNQNYVQSAIHTPSSSGNTVNLGGQTVATVSNQFHVYELIWTSERMVFSVDGTEHYTYNPAVKNADTWPFDTDQYILLNVAILPSIIPAFTESSMEIDYVRVYQESSLSTDTNDFNRQVFLFPNPVTDTLTIKMSQNFLREAKAKIYSVLGRELGSFVLNKSETLYDVSHYKKGIYLLKIETGTGFQTYKIIKR